MTIALARIRGSGSLRSPPIDSALPSFNLMFVGIVNKSVSSFDARKQQREGAD